MDMKGGAADLWSGRASFFPDFVTQKTSIL